MQMGRKERVWEEEEWSKLHHQNLLNWDGSFGPHVKTQWRQTDMNPKDQFLDSGFWIPIHTGWYQCKTHESRCLTLSILCIDYSESIGNTWPTYTHELLFTASREHDPSHLAPHPIGSVLPFFFPPVSVQQPVSSRCACRMQVLWRQGPPENFGIRPCRVFVRSMLVWLSLLDEMNGGRRGNLILLVGCLSRRASSSIIWSVSVGESIFVIQLLYFTTLNHFIFAHEYKSPVGKERFPSTHCAKLENP